MAKPKKIFFYYSAKIHNAYRHMILNPPKGFEITQSEGMAYSVGGKAPPSMTAPHVQLIRSIQPHFSQFYNRALIELGMPKIRTFDALSQGYDLIHSGQSILKTNVPYVMDFEHAAVFGGYNQYSLSKPKFSSALKRLFLDKNLKKLTPWSNAARESLLNAIPDKELESKIETVYPVITPPAKIERKRHNGVNFLFVGTTFYEKGAYDAALAFDKISERYDATLTIVSNIPEEARKQFAHNQKIKLFPLQPYEKVKELYFQSDVFVFPTHYDTFGFVIPEALSFGLPVLSVDSFSTPELVEHERTGLIIPSFYSCFGKDRGYAKPTADELSKSRSEACRHPTEEYINKMAEAMERLIEDSSLRAKLSASARKETTEGKFSPKVWKEKMGRIYREALE